MANMNMPPVAVPPLKQTLTKWAVRFAILLAIIAVWVLFLDGPTWLWSAWAILVVVVLALILIARRWLGGMESTPPASSGDSGDENNS